MKDINLYLDARNLLVAEMRKEMLGPGSEYSIPDEEHEIITDLPEVRYSVGILFPQKNVIRTDNDDIPAKTGCNSGNEEIEEFDSGINEEAKQKDKRYYGSIAEDTDVNTLDEEVTLATQNMPSSMGFTFFLNFKPDKLIFDIYFGTYNKVCLNECVIPFAPENSQEYELPDRIKTYVEFSREKQLLKANGKITRKDIRRIEESGELGDGLLRDCLYRLCNQIERGYIRKPHKIEVEITFTSEENYSEIMDLDGCRVKLSVLRKKYIEGMYAITAMLVNTETGSYKGDNSILQPVIKISSENNQNVNFQMYLNREQCLFSDIEEESLELLYRKKKAYATGHGVSVQWDVDDSGYGCIYTEFVPESMVPQMDFDIKSKSVPYNSLSMKYLSDLDSDSKETKVANIKALVDVYSEWIDSLDVETEKLDARYRNAAKRHISDCRESCNRMYRGLDLLKNSDIIYNAFALANRAMFMQRIHSEIQKKDSYPHDYKLQEEMAELNYYTCCDKNTRWRPFQLAFLLMSINSIVTQSSEERDLVDLIWFPTGGGKTEAYLGLTAFTIFFRRLSFVETCGGTTVIMRYTLRLLAAQQFTRAGTLICACESIRKDCERRSKYPFYSLGKERITIGLWIGDAHTPNKNKSIGERPGAIKCVTELRKANISNIDISKNKYNKFQVLKCPWCGTKLVRERKEGSKQLIGAWGYELGNKNKFFIRCTQENCEFQGSLPIQVVDEELYDNPPTLLFGTVDKFAMLPWKNDVGSFFATDSENRSPELIIQDELHLISGPLGTIVGLYESAIDALCSSKGVKPKIIASTATIRRAKEQCSSLYNREVRQFPSPGLDSSDSFFAREASFEDKPGRLYIGIMPSGKTKAMIEIRSIAAMLQRVHMMHLPDHVKDKLWTLAVYFNSLRDLGKCITLVDDDVKDFMKRIVYRFGTKNYRTIASADELTSRISTSQLNETLEKLETYTYSEQNIKDKKYPINVLLATNMISVGVDVARLNVMLLVGQPKLTSEYIQASSRIGRTYPGVAFVLYDGAKSRDRSHYEQFRAYHESFYKFVEPTGVTPYSKPARERALHSVLITLMRHKYGLSQDAEAALFKKDMFGVNEIEQYILQRIAEINRRSEFELSDESAEIAAQMQEFWDDWQIGAETSGRNNFFYGDRFFVSEPSDDNKRLIKSYGSEGSDVAKETLTSMRNVDKSVIAGMIVWEE